MGAAQRQPPAAPSRSVVSEQASPGKAWKTKHSCTENMKTTRKIASSTVSNTRKLYPNAARWKRWSSGQQALPQKAPNTAWKRGRKPNREAY